MGIDGHLESLRGQHAALEAQIRDEDLRPAPDMERLQALKRHRLRIKEEMERTKEQIARSVRH